MRVRTVVCCLATLTIVASTTPAIAGSTTPPTPAAPESVLTTKAASGRVRLVQPKQGAIARPAGVAANAKPATVAAAHLAEQAKVLGVDAGDLRPQATRRVAGNDVVRFQQTIDGIPVFAGQLVTVLDKAGNLELATGETIAQPGKAFPRLSRATAEQLAATARKAVVEQEKLESTAKLTVESTGRQWYAPELIGEPGSTIQPVLSFAVTGPGYEPNYQVMVDVQTKRVVLATSQHRHALNRAICDNSDRPGQFPLWCIGEEPWTYTRTEGQAPTGVTDVDQMYDYIEDTSDLYAERTGVDLTGLIGKDVGDETGKAIRATVRTCGESACPWRHTMWLGDGHIMFGTGMVTDDLVGHELSHGALEEIVQLYPRFQSGSIDEGLADFWGEVVDLGNGSSDDTPENRWKIGEGSAAGVIRDAADPTAAGHPDRMGSSLWMPYGFFDGAPHANAGVFSKTAYLVSEGGSFNGYAITGLGADKTATIIGTMQELLTTGSDYKDVFSLLPLACRQQVGQPDSTITEADCREADKAVRSTELYRDPPQGAPKKVGYCDTGLTRHHYRAGFESKSEGWTFGRDTEDSDGWRLSNEEIHSYVADGRDAAYQVMTTGGHNRALAQQQPIVLPAKAFLRFEHGYHQEGTYSGLLVEYLVTGGTWTPASALPNVNGEDLVRDVLGGKKSFGVESYGYGSTRYDLSSLAGKPVRFRFRGVSGGHGAYWWVDNLSVYTC